MADPAEVKAKLRAAFRDFRVDGVPSSGANEPVKREVRAGLDAAIDLAAQSTVTKAVATKADLASIPSPAVGDSARVMSDPLGDVADGNGVWSWTGSAWAWVGPWVDPSVTSAVDNASQVLLSQQEVFARALPGDIRGYGAVVDGTGKLLQWLEPTEEAAVVSASAFAPTLEQSVVGPVSADGRALPGALLLPSLLMDARRQVAPSGLAYLSGESPSRLLRVRRRTGGDVTVSIPGADPVSFVQNGDMISYAPSSGGIVDELITPERFASGVSSLEMIPVYGQSNSNGGDRTVGVVSLAPPRPGRALMFSRGTRLTQSTRNDPLPIDDIACLRDSFERREVIEVLPVFGQGETPCTGLGTYLVDASAPSVAVLTATFGVGGAAISLLVKGTQPYANLLRGVMRAKVIAEMSGKLFSVPAVAWVQGESNAGPNYATYRAALDQLQTDLDTDIRAITGQSEPVLLAAAQTSSWTVANIARSETVLAALDLALAHPGRFICTGPMYAFDYADVSHLDAISTRNHGAMIGRAIHRKRSGVAQPMLYAASAVRDGATVTVTMAGGEGALALDTSYVSNPGDYGLAFNQDGAAPPAITGITVSGQTVLINLASVPTGANQRVDIGRTGISGAAGGRLTGPRTCLRDSAPGVRPDGSPFHKYACHQTILIGA